MDGLIPRTDHSQGLGIGYGAAHPAPRRASASQHSHARNAARVRIKAQPSAPPIEDPPHRDKLSALPRTLRPSARTAKPEPGSVLNPVRCSENRRLLDTATAPADLPVNLSPLLRPALMLPAHSFHNATAANK